MQAILKSLPLDPWMTVETTYGSALVVADRWYPSSKTCSGCGWLKPSLPRSERMFRCGNKLCGLVIDRDLNAALNLAALVRAILTGTASSGRNRPGDLLSLRAGRGEVHGLARVLLGELRRRHRPVTAA